MGLGAGRGGRNAPRFGGTGTGSAASRRVNWGSITLGRGGDIFRGFQPRPEDPRLSAGAVFIGSGVALLALGAVL